MYAVSAAQMLRWARRQVAAGEAELVVQEPRYHPTFLRWVIDVPGLRELASWNVLLVLRRVAR
jgi:hypothetical protein